MGFHSKIEDIGDLYPANGTRTLMAKVNPAPENLEIFERVLKVVLYAEVIDGLRASEDVCHLWHEQSDYLYAARGNGSNGYLAT